MTMKSLDARPYRANRWAVAVHGQAADWLEGLGAEYGACRVDDDGTREISWTLPQGFSFGGKHRRYRQLLFRALHGNRNSWEVVYREAAVALGGGTVRYYASTSTRADLTGLQPAAVRLVQGRLPHLARPVATCGHAVPDGRLAPLLARPASWRSPWSQPSSTGHSCCGWCSLWRLSPALCGSATGPSGERSGSTGEGRKHPRPQVAALLERSSGQLMVVIPVGSQ
ncbi:hypothetical protein [Amycolatopsis anabasis]|uniref:hypothetical protein n=1 Tax=Amycolatopsis anabasis TaxID=1840409 RepID=UPI00131B25D0|nr:hypothetical protein [Amycolatopsis anabasis]